MDGALDLPSPRVDSELAAAMSRYSAVPGPTPQPSQRHAALPPRTTKLGATWDGKGTTFSLYAADASEVRVALLDASGKVSGEFQLTHHRNNEWSGYVPGCAPGQRYGFRVDGPYDPAAGLRHNPNNLLLDPWGKAVTGKPSWNDSTYAYDRSQNEWVPSTADSAGSVPCSVVVDDRFDWGDDRRPEISDGQRLIYETHVRGMTKEHPSVAGGRRGTFSALGDRAVTSHLRKIGATSVELLPAQAILDRQNLVDAGLVNYWGYDTIGFFAPEQRYAAGSGALDAVREFKEMVRALHAEGLEVIMDVVYNHTPEGDSRGPSISLRGVDNRTYYMLRPGDPRNDIDVTGCGNTVNVANPQTVRLVLESLRYWAEEMHVDGFRFDEAPALARRDGGSYDAWSAFLAAVNADPVLHDRVLIAEAWDAGPNNYQQGNFPAGWSEWNSRFRDTVRDFWRGSTAGVSDFATRLAGSQDLFGRGARGPLASINFVTCHDGFTLRDVVSYNGKHNLANGENNRDGTDDNHSWNHGVEGPTADAGINALRARQQRNMLATLYLSLGTPMILGGDELNRTQGGNNNAYNQDNAISWFDWQNADPELLAFTERLAALRASQPVLQRTTYLEGRTGPGPHDRDCVWLREDGGELTAGDWHDGSRRSVALLLNGEMTGERHPDGSPVTGDTLLTIHHSGDHTATWTMPPDWGNWEVVLDSNAPAEAEGTRRVAAGGTIDVEARSVVVLRRAT